MRAFEGQRSDNQPVERNRGQKEKLIRELKENLAAMKPHTTPALRESVRKRIADLETELRVPTPAKRW